MDTSNEENHIVENHILDSYINIDENKQIIDFIDIPRHKPENFYNYTAEELAEKEVEVKKMGELYPKVPAKWVEDIYDLLKNEPDKMDEIINNMKEGKYDKK